MVLIVCSFRFSKGEVRDTPLDKIATVAMLESLKHPFGDQVR